MSGFDATNMTYRLGIDVGGTFTDLLLFNEATVPAGAVSSRPTDLLLSEERAYDPP